MMHTTGTEHPRSFVVDRHGNHVPVLFDIITARNEALCTDPRYGPTLAVVDCPLITADVVSRFRSGMSTRELDAETVGICTSYATRHTDYDALAARVMVSDLHKRTPADLAEMVAALQAAAPDRESLRYSDEYLGVVARGRAAIAQRLVPERDFILRTFGFQTLARSYLVRPTASDRVSSLVDTQLMERPQHLFMRVGLGLCVCQPDGQGHAASDADFARRLEEAFELYDALSLQRVSNATPTLLNAGTYLTQLSSCFMLSAGDDLRSLLEVVPTAGMISKMSGGISIALHALRAEGALIRSSGGRGSGIKHYVGILDKLQKYADQGGNRPGAFALYLGVDHDDILTFLNIARLKCEPKYEALQARHVFAAMWVPDMFWEALEAQLANDARVEADGLSDPTAGDWALFSPDTAPGLHLAYGQEYRELRTRYIREGRARRVIKAGEIIEAAFKSWRQTGRPYVLHKDAINRKSNMMNVAPVVSSNLCVAGDSLVLTDAGFRRIAELAGQDTRVWNGMEWAPVTVMQTNLAAGLVRVILEDGLFLDCTPYHKFYSAEGLERPASSLRPGDELEACPGWHSVDAGTPAAGAYEAGHAGLSAPLQADIASRVEWLAGLCDSFGAVEGGEAGEESSIRIQGTDRLVGARLLLQTLSFGGLPSAARGELRISSRIARTLVTVFGFSPRRLTLPAGISEPEPAAPPRVSAVITLPGRYPTFCFTEPLRHRGVFNGVYCGQCCEITIPAWSTFDAPTLAKFHPGNAGHAEIGVCNLAAVCLETFVTERGGEVHLDFAGIAGGGALETRTLNRVIDLNLSPDPACAAGNKRHRPIGVGVLGTADVLARLSLPYGSQAAAAKARGIAAVLHFASVQESCALAERDGPYETFEGSPISQGLLQPDLWVRAGDLEPDWEAQVETATYGYLRPADWAALRVRARRGVRNAFLNAYMPTATTSNLTGQNESFEPFSSNLYTRETLAGEFFIINRHLMRRLAALGLWDDQMREALLASGGSIQGIERIPPEVRRLFRTAREIHPSLHIRMAKAMAPFICQSMSFNLQLNEPSLPVIIRFLLEGWKEGLKCGMYYCHSRAATGSQKAAAPERKNAEPAAGPAEPAAAEPAAEPAVAEPATKKKRIQCTEDVCVSCRL